MAAEIKENEDKLANVRKPVLLNKIEGIPDIVNQALIIPKEDGVISVSDDRTLRIWLKRDSGQYWPSICHSLPSAVSCLDYNPQTRRLFVGQESGTISEFDITEDYNRLIHQKDYLAHQSRVTAVKFSLRCEWVLSCSKDKYFMWHCSETGRRLSGYQANAACLCLEFDEESKYAFIGDYSGQIAVLKLKDNSFDFIAPLKGHSGWFLRFLVSLKLSDVSLAFYLIHRDKVQGIAHARLSQQLITGADDSILGIWDMQVKRLETPDWVESDVCQKCDAPFFWNFRKMWEDKKVGMRQHHCRRCGKALCHVCCSKTSTLPIMGFEYPVRVCDACFDEITPEDKAPHATFHDLKHSIVHMHLDEPRKILLTTGKDRVMKLWDMRDVLA
ncbi:hypothetical protein EGW08_006816 [Elysia chlorotica]|uniref:FYVE-type domain-containing protein n=1 Tax=Elysia chlorotica TaxID=188477 RepID=A0A3S1BCY4_ELYCH|nr:hypothetical protein EGW08_006816 [Elysia chlorotica]